MARPYENLRKKMSPEARARAEAKAQQLLAEMPLHELRAARRMTQEQLAETLHIKQASVSKMEKRTDMYISTLRKLIEAMGGELRIEAEFPEGKVEITSFSDTDAA
jgi:transcriptional regulator with XRE-family HTH domain